MNREQIQKTYADLLGRQRPISVRHPPMPRLSRAAQFAPFAALTGHSDAVSETARLTQTRPELDEGVIAELNIRIGQLRERLAERPAVEITYFAPDSKKAGGAYVTVRGRVCKVRELEKQLVLADDAIISIEQILTLRFL